jgi:hypothetical protein
MIAAPVVALREIDQLAADTGRSGIARQFEHLAGHLAAMIAVRKRRRGLDLCQRYQISGSQKLEGGANKTINPIPIRTVTISVVNHTRLTNLNYFQMPMTITTNTPKGRDMKILKGRTIMLNLI